MTVSFLPARHLMTLVDHDCRFGHTYRPVCECGYRGPLVSFKRADAIADEHRAKERGIWKAAR